MNCSYRNYYNPSQTYAQYPQKKSNGRFNKNEGYQQNFANYGRYQKQVEFEAYSTESSDRDHDTADFESRLLDGFSIKVCGEFVVQDDYTAVMDTDVKMIKFAASKELALPRQDDLPLPKF